MPAINDPLYPNGFNLSAIVLETLENLKNNLQRRMENEKTKFLRTRSPKYRALRRQYNTVVELIRIGRQTFTPSRISRIYTIVVSNELYPIPDD